MEISQNDVNYALEHLWPLSDILLTHVSEKNLLAISHLETVYKYHLFRNNLRSHQMTLATTKIFNAHAAYL